MRGQSKVAPSVRVAGRLEVHEGLVVGMHVATRTGDGHPISRSMAGRGVCFAAPRRSREGERRVPGVLDASGLRPGVLRAVSTGLGPGVGLAGSGVLEPRATHLAA